MLRPLGRRMNVLEGLLAGLQMAGQGQVYRQQRTDAEADNRLRLLMTLAPHLQDPRAALAPLARRAGLDPAGLQFRDPAEERRQEIESEINRAEGLRLMGMAPDFENPAALFDAGAVRARGLPLPGRPQMTLGTPGIAPPGGPALPFTLPAAGGVRSAFDQAGRQVADIRSEREQAAILQRQREGDAADAARAAANQAAITARAEHAADQRAKLEAVKAGFQAGTKAFDAFVSTHRQLNSKFLIETNDANLANELANAGALEAVQRGSQFLSSQVRPQITLEPFPDFTNRLPTLRSTRQVEVQERNSDTNAFRADETARKNQEVEKQKKRRLDQQMLERGERIRHNKAMEARPSGRGNQGGTQKGQGGFDRADEIELIDLRGTIARLEKEINKNRPLAQKGDKAAADRLQRGENGLRNVIARRDEILNKYRKAGSGSGALSPTEARSRYIATLRKGDPAKGIPGVSAQEAEAMANRRKWR